MSEEGLVETIYIPLSLDNVAQAIGSISAQLCGVVVSQAALCEDLNCKLAGLARQIAELTDSVNEVRANFDQHELVGH